MRGYTKDLAGVKLLSKEEKLALWAKMKEGDISARNALAESCLRLVKSIVSRMYAYNKHYDDLLADAYLELVKVVEKWEPDKGELTTIVTHNLQQAFMRQKQQYNLIRLTRNAFKKLNFSKEQIDSSRIDVRRGILAAQSTQNLKKYDFRVEESLNSEYYREYFSFKEEDTIEQDKQLLKEAFTLSRLSTKDKYLLNMRFKEGLTLKEIGQKFGGISKEYVRQLEAKILGRIKSKVAFLQKQVALAGEN